jgi:hypothetical protein
MKEKETGEFEISRDEWIVIGSVLAFAFVWILFITPSMMYSDWFSNLMPPIQYLIYHIGHIILTFIVFGTPTGFTIKKKVDFWGIIRGGVFSWLCISFIIDIWIAPFSINPEGRFIIKEGETLVGTSVDYMVGWSYSKISPGIEDVFVSIPFWRTFSMLFVLTYFLTPIIAAFLMALVLRPKMFKNLIVR